MVPQNCQKETSNSRNPLKGGTNERSEGLSGDSHGEAEDSQPTESRGDAEARGDFWSIQGDVIYRHPEFNSACLEKKHSQYHGFFDVILYLCSCVPDRDL